jgi:hypothetical protein
LKQPAKLKDVLLDPSFPGDLGFPLEFLVEAAGAILRSLL